MIKHVCCRSYYFKTQNIRHCIPLAVGLPIPTTYHHCYSHPLRSCLYSKHSYRSTKPHIYEIWCSNHSDTKGKANCRVFCCSWCSNGQWPVRRPYNLYCVGGDVKPLLLFTVMTSVKTVTMTAMWNYKHVVSNDGHKWLMSLTPQEINRLNIRHIYIYTHTHTYSGKTSISATPPWAPCCSQPIPHTSGIMWS